MKYVWILAFIFGFTFTPFPAECGVSFGFAEGHRGSSVYLNVDNHRQRYHRHQRTVVVHHNRYYRGHHTRHIHRQEGRIYYVDSPYPIVVVPSGVRGHRHHGCGCGCGY